MPMVTHFRVETLCGMFLTDCNEFTHDVDDAVQFRSEDDACEEADRHPGSSVERFQRWSPLADIETHVSVPVHTLQELRRLFIAFEDDKASNVMPLDKNIALGRELLQGALNAPRQFERRDTFMHAAE